MIAYRASIFHILCNPDTFPGQNAHEYIHDGLMIIDKGHIVKVGEYHLFRGNLPRHCTVIDKTGMIIMPGFIDTHIHLPQTDMIASFGKQLMDWLDIYTYPCEKKFGDPDIARETSAFFLRELLKNGTTTAQVLGSVHPVSVDAVCEEAVTKGMRLVAGKVMMDRNAPDYLLDTPQSSYDGSKALIERWHGKHRITYAVTPRFALTSSEAQLEMAGSLIKEFKDVRLHTHLAENVDEVKLIARAYPSSNSYLDVYDRFGLVCDRSVFAHCIQLSHEEFRVMKNKGASVSLCPTSNLFLGSGLFDLKTIHDMGLKAGWGTDVGGGTSFSMIRTMAEAYKVCQLKGQSMSPVTGFYHATLGAAEVLGLDHMIGNFKEGKEADLIVINPSRNPLLQRRLSFAESLEDILFAIMILGDDRIIEETIVFGEPV